MRSVSYATLIATMIGATGPGSAQMSTAPISICDIAPAEFGDLVPTLVGSWTTSNLAGHAVISSGGAAFGLPVPLGPRETVNLVLREDMQLRAVNWTSASAQDVEFAISDEATILDEAADFIPGLWGQFDEEDASSAAGCDIGRYPHLRASGSVQGDSGVIHWTSSFVVVSSNSMIGARRFHVATPDGSISGFYSVNFTR